MRAHAFALVVFAVWSAPAIAGQADCHDYTEATGEDRSLFNGFIYGYVSALLDHHSPTEINAVTMKVKREVDKYCLLQPADSPNGAVAVFARAEAMDRRR